jgi:hypothetical protein
MDDSEFLTCLSSDYGRPRDAAAVRPSPRGMPVEDGASDHPRVAIQAAPGEMLRWLWGRADDSAIRLAGDPEWAGYLRRMLAEVTELAGRG